MSESKKLPEDYLRGTHKRIAALLADGPMDIAAIAQRLGLSYEAIASTLRGMRNRGEVVALKVRLGKPNRYKLKAKAVAA